MNILDELLICDRNLLLSSTEIRGKLIRCKIRYLFFFSQFHGSCYWLLKLSFKSYPGLTHFKAMKGWGLNLMIVSFNMYEAVTALSLYRFYNAVFHFFILNSHTGAMWASPNANPCQPLAQRTYRSLMERRETPLTTPTAAHPTWSAPTRTSAWMTKAMTCCLRALRFLPTLLIRLNWALMGCPKRKQFYSKSRHISLQMSVIMR